MTGLYRRLFTYRERPDRSPLEDFLTEALADLLNRLPAHFAQEVVAFLLSSAGTGIDEIKEYWKNGTNIGWTTQKTIGGGVIDLLMEIDNVPFIVIESKIGAGFQEHQVESGHDDGYNKRNQLATYGSWLAGKAPSGWGGAIVLLTHWTPPPSDFLNGSQIYKCRHRSVARWAALSRLLKSFSQSTEYYTSDWARLSGELVAFLKEEKMDSELATGHDLAALRIYDSSADRIRNSVEQIWESARLIWRPICQQTSIPLEISTNYGCVWKYRYLSRSDLRRSYLAVGIRYPDVSSYSVDIAPDGAPYLFVELASEAGTSAITGLGMPECWIVLTDMRLAVRSLRDFPTDPELFVSAAEAWVNDRIIEVAQALT